MKIVWLRAALPTAILSIVFAAPCGAGNTDTTAISKRDLQAKIDYCQTCHGPAGQGFRGYYPIPRLAGQQTEVIENQLRAFIERRRTNNIMFNVAGALSPAMITAIASHFRELDSKPIGGAPKELITAGKKIYEEGVPDASVPACSSCHGPEAKGDAQFPRLAGQLNDYILKKLTNWSKERGQNPAAPDTSAIMQPIAQSLTELQIKAVAAYLNYLE
jgi:cytochrome c553